jgi:hypothetical protein
MTLSISGLSALLLEPSCTPKGRKMHLCKTMIHFSHKNRFKLPKFVIVLQASLINFCRKKRKIEMKGRTKMLRKSGSESLTVKTQEGES